MAHGGFMTILETQQPAEGGRDANPVAASKPHRPTRRPLSNVQRLIVTGAALPLVGIVLTLVAATAGLVSPNAMVDIALTLGEEPGMFVFGAMLWCSPVQWALGRTQIRVRKILGILFAGYAVANFLMFVIEEGLADSLSAPFLIAGSLATLASIPLLLTSGQWAQRKMGMKKWRTLHKLTYLIAFALVLHVALIGEIGISGILVLAALAARIPPVANAIRRSRYRL